MVKRTRKPKEIQTNTINSVLTDNKTPPKSRQQINKEYYQKNKEKRNTQEKERYAKKKQQAQLSTKQQSAKYYGAEAIKVLMSFKEYTELNKDKMKLWADFNWTLKDCKEDIHDIAAIMKLREVADNLVRDYWETAKKEIRKGKSWNSLDYDEQQRLIKYWGYEKARIENGYIDEVERLEKQGDSYYKDIEMAKYHEERGKIKCGCWQCEAKQEVQKEVKAERKKIIKDYEEEQKKSGEMGEKTEWIKGECANCGEYKKVDSDSGICGKCDKEQEK